MRGNKSDFDFENRSGNSESLRQTTSCEDKLEFKKQVNRKLCVPGEGGSAGEFNLIPNQLLPPETDESLMIPEKKSGTSTTRYGNQK